MRRRARGWEDGWGRRGGDARAGVQEGGGVQDARRFLGSPGKFGGSGGREAVGSHRGRVGGRLRRICETRRVPSPRGPDAPPATRARVPSRSLRRLTRPSRARVATRHHTYGIIGLTDRGILGLELLRVPLAIRHRARHEVGEGPERERPTRTSARGHREPEPLHALAQVVRARHQLKQAAGGHEVFPGVFRGFARAQVRSVASEATFKPAPATKSDAPSARSSADGSARCSLPRASSVPTSAPFTKLNAMAISTTGTVVSLMRRTSG